MGRLEKNRRRKAVVATVTALSFILAGCADAEDDAAQDPVRLDPARYGAAEAAWLGECEQYDGELFVGMTQPGVPIIGVPKLEGWKREELSNELMVMVINDDTVGVWETPVLIVSQAWYPVSREKALEIEAQTHRESATDGKVEQSEWGETCGFPSIEFSYRVRNEDGWESENTEISIFVPLERPDNIPIEGNFRAIKLSYSEGKDVEREAYRGTGRLLFDHVQMAL